MTARSILRFLAAALLAVTVLLIAAVLLLQTPWARDRLRRYAEVQAERALAADVTIGRLSGSLFTGAAVTDVVVSREGKAVVTLPRATVDYDIYDLVTGSIDIARIRVDGPVVHLRRNADGRLNVLSLLRPRPRREGPGRGWSIGRIVLSEGVVYIDEGVVASGAVNEPERLVNVTGEVGLGSAAGRPGSRIDIASLAFDAENPDLRVRALTGRLLIASDLLGFDDVAIDLPSGSLRVDGEIRERSTVPVYDFATDVREVPLASLAPLIPALEGYTLTPTMTARMKGPAALVETSLDLATEEGDVRADLHVDVEGPERGLTGTVHVTDFNLAAFRAGQGEATDVTGTSVVDLALSFEEPFVAGTYTLDAREAAYGRYRVSDLDARGRIEGRRIEVRATTGLYGGRANVRGVVTLPQAAGRFAYDLRGQIRGVEPAAVPDPFRPYFAESLHGRPEEASGDATDAPAAVAGRGVEADFDIRGRGEDFEVAARLTDAGIAGAGFGEDTEVEASWQGGRLRYSAVGTVRHLDLRRLGRALEWEFLTAEHFASLVNADFDVTGGGTDLDSLSLAGVVNTSDSTLFGGDFPLTLKPALEDGRGTVAVQGRFGRLNPGAAVHRPPIDGDLNGALDGWINFENLAETDWSPASFDASVTLRLEDSSLHGVRIAGATIAADLADSLLQVRQFEVSGPDLAARLSGSVALDRSGSSALDYFIDTPPLERVEGLDRPLRGSALVEGRLTGNLSRFVVDGKLLGSLLGYGDAETLSVDTAYHAEIPDLDWTRSEGTTDVNIALLEAAGRTFRTLSGKASWAETAVSFDASLRDATRTLDVGGRLVWHADHQELHLTTLTLAAETMRWSLAPGSEPALRYAPDAVEIDRLVLAGDQGGEVRLSGALGPGLEPLEVQVAGVALAPLNGVVFEDQGLSGTLDATAEVTGSLQAPVVRATIAVASGAVQDFKYERLTGAVSYEQRRLDVDLRLQQTADAWLTATGRVPVGAAAGDSMDVRVESTPIDLAVVQGFTDELQQVTGGLQVKFRATGSIAEPNLDGWMRVTDGAFSVRATGSRYTGLDTHVDFQPQVVVIQQFELVDDEEHRMQVGGQLAIRGREVGNVDVRVTSNSFEVADNRFAELEVGLNVRVRGDLRQPRIEGDVSLTDGRIRIDRVLEALKRPYALPEEDAEAGEEARQPFVPTIALRVRIPDTLIFAGSNLRTGGTVGLGDINVTIGGNLVLAKNPDQPFELRGDVRTVRGTYEFQGRHFEIEPGGTVEFLGGAEVDPLLDVTATQNISAVLTRVHISGSFRQPALRLSSDPPLDDAQILSLIVFNQPLDLLATGAQVTLADRAAMLASGFVTSRLSESIGEALELDVFEIQASQVNGVVPTVTVGEQFGDLYVRLRQHVGPETLSQLIVEYGFTEWLRLQTVVASDDPVVRTLLRRVERTGLDLLFRFTY